MRSIVLLAICGLACAQPPDPAYEPLTRAYGALHARDYETAIADFLKAAEAVPKRASIHKDLAYAYLKIGENVLARDQFRDAMKIDPGDTQVAMEYAFLCFETKEQAQARRIFDRIRKTGNATAEQAFRNIDAPLAAGIERWKSAIAMGSDNFSAHFELATLAEQRDELELAAEHYEKAWRLQTDRRSVLVDWGRVLKALGKDGPANAALLAASRGGESRAAEMAREFLPDRYPFVPEFQAALVVDPHNSELRRELGYLLLRMDRTAEAEQEFRILTETAPGDMLAAAQLGFLLYGQGDRRSAMPLFERVLAGPDEALANRVRSVLGMPALVVPRPELDAASATIDAKVLAERSIKAGYMQDALKYLQIAHETDAGDFDIVLKLGWTNNILHRDRQAIRWFDLARKSPDPAIASEAARAFHNLEGPMQQFHTSVWAFPLFSTRWHDLFGYAQIKTEVRTGLRIQPYVSLRFVGDTRETIGPTPVNGPPQYLSESSFIVAAGVRTIPWHQVTGWFEAGSAIGFLSGHMLPDYRGGVNAVRGVGHTLGAESPGWFADTTLDGVFVSRFDEDFMVYSQSRFGYTVGPKELRAQLYWNADVTFDARRQYWANFGETGPGIRIHAAAMPPSMFVTVNGLRGAYFINAGNPRGPNYNDFRVGVWYAFTR